jgi:2-polyprenyl-3-methyl-5-hydroxy-6-metoxy-1,4-benzoquinol methylase
MAVVEIDQTRAEEFGGRMLGNVTDGMVALAMGVGHRTGLYDALAELAPATSDAIAERAGLQERYVREWLAGQLAAGIVEYDVDAHTWWLPPEHAASLTRAAGGGNLALLAASVSRFAELEDDVLAAFRNGGGVPWSRMNRVQEWQSEFSYGVFGDIEQVVGLAPGLSERLTAGIDVADVGCGRGHASLRLGAAYPESRILGIDQAAPAIDDARAEAAKQGLGNVRFDVRDAAKLEPGAYDAVLALDVIHDLAHPYETLRSIHEALRPGGVLLMAELALSSRPEENARHPLAAALYTVSVFHCMAGSLSENGEGIGVAWGDERIRAALADARFGNVELRMLEHDPLNAYYIAERA